MDRPLAPDIVEAILDGRQPAELGVRVLRGYPAISSRWPTEAILEPRSARELDEFNGFEIQMPALR